MQMLGSSITKHEKLVVSYSYRAKGKVEFSLRNELTKGIKEAPWAAQYIMNDTLQCQKNEKQRRLLNQKILLQG